MNEKKDLKKGEKAAAVTALISLALALTKGFAGIASGSVVLISDAIHSSTDILAGVTAWFGLKIAQRKPDEKFPYGYYKAENLATLIVAGIIFYAAIETMYDGYLAIIHPSGIEMPFIALGAAAVSIAASFWNKRYLDKVGKEINSESLKANAADKKIDIFASSLVFIAIALAYFEIPYIEGVITIGISLLILKIGFEIARDSVFALMDVSANRETEEQVVRIVKSVPGVDGIGSIKLRKTGPFIFGEISIKIKKYLDVQRAHGIAERIEKRVKKAVPEIESLNIHVEPFIAKEQKLCVPVTEEAGMKSRVMNQFGRAKKFLFVTVDVQEGIVKEHYFKENPFKKKDVKAGLNASHFISDEDTDALVTTDIGEISFHTLRDHLVEVYYARGETAKEVAENFAKGKLERLDKPTKE